jgi:hypothetical protein
VLTVPGVDGAAVVPCGVHEECDVFVEVVVGDHGLLGFVGV